AEILEEKDLSLSIRLSDKFSSQRVRRPQSRQPSLVLRTHHPLFCWTSPLSPSVNCHL
ncbi:hypothetical protein LEMLEM_LOCUS23742, partial [Lemmus lemmus]